MSDFLSHLRATEFPNRLRALYCLIFLAAFAHAVVTEGALTCCPPGYADLETFVECGQAAGLWTAAAIALVEVTVYMVLLVPKAYNKIKDEGRAEGIAVGVERGRAEGERAERERIAAALDAAGITDPETRRIVMNGSRNGQ